MMTSLDKNLSVIRKDIKNAIEKTIEEQRGQDESLSDLEKVIYGDKMDKGKLKGQLPATWIIPMPHTPDVNTANAEDHPFKFGFASLVQNKNDHEQGRHEAENLSSRVYDVIAEDRRLNQKVHDTYPGQIIPVQEFPEGPGTFWSGFEFNFLVRRNRYSNP